MTLKNHLIFWCLAFAAFLGLVYLFQAVLLPFVLGAAIAYLLNPAVNALAKYKLSRGPATLVILFGFLIFTLALMVIIVPIFYKQVVEFSGDVPGYLDQIVTWLEPKIRELMALAGVETGTDLQVLAKEYASPAFNMANFMAGYFVKGLAAGGQAAANMISILVIMPIVAYFMMKEWPNISAKVIDLLPRHQEKNIMEILKEIDKKLSGFIRGQLTVAFVLGVGYALALSLAGLKYGFLIGVLSGVLSIIPLVGSTVGLLLSVGVAWFQTGGEFTYVAMIAGIFIIGQIIEGNIITPKLIGNSVGLHPLWIFFALMAGGALFGIVGMFLAVPVAAVVSVLIAFGLKAYKASPYYKAAPPKPKPSAKQKAKKKKAKSDAAS